MANSKKRPLKDMSIQDLAGYFELAEMMFSYYDNDARANLTEHVDVYKKAYEKTLYYTKIKNMIFDEIESRFQEGLFA